MVEGETDRNGDQMVCDPDDCELDCPLHRALKEVDKYKTALSEVKIKISVYNQSGEQLKGEPIIRKLPTENTPCLNWAIIKIERYEETE